MDGPLAGVAEKLNELEHQGMTKAEGVLRKVISRINSDFTRGIRQLVFFAQKESNGFDLSVHRTQALGFWTSSRFIFETRVVGLICNNAAAPFVP